MSPGLIELNDLVVGFCFAIGRFNRKRNVNEDRSMIAGIFDETFDLTGETAGETKVTDACFLFGGLGMEQGRFAVFVEFPRFVELFDGFFLIGSGDIKRGCRV